MLTLRHFTASVRLHFTNHSLSYNERCVRALMRGVQIVECVTNVRAIFNSILLGIKLSVAIKQR